MKISLNKTSIYRIASLSAPLLCVGIAIAMSTMETVRLNHLAASIVDLKTENAASRALIAEVEKHGSAGFITIEPDTRQEQVTFVNMVRGVADTTHVRLTQWAPGTVQTIAVPDTASKAMKDEMAKVQPIANTLGVTGTYSEIRNFLLAILAQDRFISISNVKWVRAAAPPGTAITFIVTRYVGAAAPTTPAAPNTTAS